MAMKLTEKIRKFEGENPRTPYFSFEYFPPKSDAGVSKLYERFDRMAALDPMWVDITWGAGGSTADKTLEVCINALHTHKMDVMMHLTCTNTTKEELTKTLRTCKEHGIRNILALRGDSSAGQGEWTQVEGGFAHATDLIAHIRKEFGDYFCVACAGYPEGHLESASMAEDLKYTKMKVDAGADMIVTQLFYDNAKFLSFVKSCRAMGITVPILPGIMSIQSVQGLKKMTSLSKVEVPQRIEDALEPLIGDEEKVKDYGVECAVEMCQGLLANGVPGLHFYTLNQESAVLRILDGLKLRKAPKPEHWFPWLKEHVVNSSEESAIPILHANRPASSIERSKVWRSGQYGDVFPQPGSFEEFIEACGIVKETPVKEESDALAIWKASRKQQAGVAVGCLKNGYKPISFVGQQQVAGASNAVSRKIPPFAVKKPEPWWRTSARPSLEASSLLALGARTFGAQQRTLPRRLLRV